MQTLMIIAWIVYGILGAASWVVGSFWIAGTPRNPWFPLSFVGQYWRYRRLRKSIAEGEPEPRFLRLYEFLLVASLAALSAALFTTVVVVLAGR